MKAQDTLLYLDGVSVSFDGFRAINNLSLVLQAGEMRAIIGPNGAGKTTMMDIITGKTRPDAGDVYFNGEVDLTKHDEAEIALLGIGRKFQKPTVFESHTVDRQSGTGALRTKIGVLDAVPSPEPGRSRTDHTTFFIRSVFMTNATGSPPISRMGKSNGWRSACCSRKTPNCFSSTSRLQG